MKSIIQLIIFTIGIYLFSGCAVTSNIPVDATDNHDESPQINPRSMQHFMDGQFYLNEGNYSMAILEFQDALRYDSNVGTIHLSLGECYWHLGKPDLAEYHLKQAIDFDPDDLEARELLAGQYVMRNELGRAKEQFTFLYKQNPENVEYILTLADLEKMNQELEKALQLYRKAYEMDPKLHHVLAAVIEIHLSQKDYDSALKTLNELIAVDPENVQYRLALADIAVELGNIMLAIETLENIIQKIGPDPEIFLQIGWLYYEIKDTDAALDIFLDVVDIDSTHQTALHALSTIFREQENSKDALYFAMEMITNDSMDVKGYINAVLAAAMDDDFQYIVELLTPVSQRFIQDFTINYFLGIGHESLESYDEAVLYFEKALIIDPESVMVLHSLAMIYDVVGEWDKSDSIYVQLMEKDSTDAQAYNNYAYSLIERNGDAELAKSLSKKAITLEPGSAAYLDTYGWILYKLGETDTGLKYIRKSIELEDTNAEVLEHLGDILTKLGKIEEAKEYYLKALENDPDNPILKEKLDSE